MKRFLIYCALLTVPAIVNAQALPFTAADYDPATLAAGGASLTNTGTVSYAVFSNPAAIAFYEDRLDVSAGYALWQPGSLKTSVINAGGAYRIGSKFGVALGFSRGAYPEYTDTDLTGYETGSFKPSCMQVGLGLGWRILPFLSVGANIGYASEKLASDVSYGAVDLDIYAMAKFGGFKAALGVSEIGGKVKSASGDAFRLPASASLGVGYGISFVEKHAIDVRADAQYYLAGDFAAAFGASYTYDNMISVRAGYRYGGDSVIPSFAGVGAGIRFFGVKLDLAYVISSSAMSDTVAVSLGYSF